MLEFIGNLQGADLKIGVVQARFNPEITGRLWARCLTELMQQGVLHKNIVHVTVPGALEIPGALARLLECRGLDALIAIGCVVRGDTYHFEIVANESARGIMDLTLKTGYPIINAILTTEDDQQAQVRITEKGVAAARCAIEMARLDKDLRRFVGIED